MKKIKANENFIFIEVPICCGSPTVGSDKAPKEIGKYIETQNPITTLEVCNTSEQTNLLLHNFKSVYDCYTKVYNAVLNAYHNDKIPIVLGGDHSLSIGSVGASLNLFNDDLIVVWIDAHTDINTPNTSISHKIHGMPNAITLGLCEKELSPNHNEYNLKGENLKVLGARSIDDKEYEIMQQNNVEHFSAIDLLCDNLTLKLDKIFKDVKAHNVHISFDVDVFDCNVFKSTGYLLPNGLNVNQVKEIITYLKHRFKMVCFDCVEYNSTLDVEEKDLQKVLDIISCAIN